MTDAITSLFDRCNQIALNSTSDIRNSGIPPVSGATAEQRQPVDDTSEPVPSTSLPRREVAPGLPAPYLTRKSALWNGAKSALRLALGCEYDSARYDDEWFERMKAEASRHRQRARWYLDQLKMERTQ